MWRDLTTNLLLKALSFELTLCFTWCVPLNDSYVVTFKKTTTDKHVQQRDTGSFVDR